MSAPAAGECLVCGTQTKNRCSACATAGIDLFFCSPEHQKLVWHVHRLFCGPGKADPWRWPPLSPAEVDAALALLDTVPFPDIKPATLGDKLLRIFNEPRDQLPHLSQSTSLPTLYESAALRCIRLHMHDQWMADYKRYGTHKPTSAATAMTGLNFWSLMYLYEHDPPAWTAGYLHRASVFVALQLSTAPAKERLTYFPGVADRVIKYLQEAAVTDPDRARKVEEGFRSFVDKWWNQFKPGGVYWSLFERSRNA
ncbi:MYND-type domain-containing protein [Rhodotorula toruloides]|nr:MYND-type domain-containing protein [Rhodotorula toruloides]